MNILRKALSWLALLIVALFTSVPKAAAALDDNTVIDRLTDRYQSVANQWGSVITGHATTIFWILVVISLVWTFGMLALRRADIGEFIAEAVRFIMFTGFYFWILTNGTTFAKQIIDSLFQIGQQSTAADHQFMPSERVAVGFKIYDSAPGECAKSKRWKSSTVKE